MRTLFGTVKSHFEILFYLNQRWSNDKFLDQYASVIPLKALSWQKDWKFLELKDFGGLGGRRQWLNFLGGKLQIPFSLFYLYLGWDALCLNFGLGLCFQYFEFYNEMYEDDITLGPSFLDAISSTKVFLFIEKQCFSETFC